MSQLTQCIKLLEERKNTHPQLTQMWTEYLFANKPTSNDLDVCLAAIENMKQIPDIDRKTAAIIYNICCILIPTE